VASSDCLNCGAQSFRSRAWFQLANGQELRIVRVPNPIRRPPAAMEIFESHLALRVPSFRGDKLHAAGFQEDLLDDHPLKIVIKPKPHRLH